MKYIKLTVFFALCSWDSGIPSLHADWADNGIPLGTASGAQDSSSHHVRRYWRRVIVWRDSRATVNTDVYAQGVARWRDTMVSDRHAMLLAAASAQSGPAGHP